MKNWCEICAEYKTCLIKDSKAKRDKCLDLAIIKGNYKKLKFLEKGWLA